MSTIYSTFLSVLNNPCLNRFDRMITGCSNLTEKVSNTAKAVFETLAKVFTFPCRYFGSKDFSIAGTILRLPLEILDRLNHKSGKEWTWKSLKHDLFHGNGYQRFFKPLSQKETRQYVRYAAATQAVAKSDSNRVVQFGYEPYELEKLQLPKGVKKCGENRYGAHENHSSGVYIDPTTGFKAFVLVDKETNEVMVSFGALGGFDVEFTNEAAKKGRRTGNYGHIAFNYLGGVPSICRQADQFIANLKNHPDMQGKTIVCTGLSMGGLMAQYASIKNEEKGVIFNSVGLGAGCQYKLGDERLKKAKDLIHHISVRGDITSANYALRVWDGILGIVGGLRLPGSFGKHYAIPSAYSDVARTHESIMGSVMQAAGYPKNRNALPLTEDDKKELEKARKGRSYGLDEHDDLFVNKHGKYSSPFFKPSKEGNNQNEL